MSDVFSPYAIDYSVKNTSKTFGFSKKKIIFKFGIANPPAVAAGETGANCRGSEHEVIFTWSLNSGKRSILADGKDVHYSETGQNGWTADQVFQHHFQIRVAGLSAPLRAHIITQPANRDVPHIKPFDLRINGVSYFGMPQIFQLGTPQMVVRPVKGKGNNTSRGGDNRQQGGDNYNGNGRHGGQGQHNVNGNGNGRHGGDDGNGSNSNLAPEERQAIAAAKVASMQDLDRSHANQMGMGQMGMGQMGFASAPAPAPAVVEDLISFDFDAPAPAAAAAAPPNQYGQQPPPPQQQQQPQYSNYSLGGSAPPPQQQFSVQSSPYASQGSFASSQQSLSQSQQFSQPPPQQQQSQQGSFYGQPAPAPASAPLPQQSQQGSFYGQPPPPPQQQQQQQQLQLQSSQQQGSGSFYGQQPPAALAPAPFDPHQQASFTSLTSPSNNTIASYQSYGSAPSFAQPPQQQQQHHQQQQQQHGSFYGQPPAPQGY